MATQLPNPSTIHFKGEKEGLESSLTTERDGLTQEGNPPATKERTEERGYLKGIKLILVLASATLATFLMMLDMTIVATVRIMSF